ncbi:MAG: CHASE4 domain-containing protein [Alphaproteobacteria bacterium]
MRLKQTIALLTGGAILAMAGLNAAVLVPVAGGFASIEEGQARRNAERVQAAIGLRLDAMVRTATDWSHWDETYGFVAGLDDGYIERNLAFDSIRTIGMNLVYFYDLAGQAIWGRSTTWTPVLCSNCRRWRRCRPAIRCWRRRHGSAMCTASCRPRWGRCWSPPRR